MRPALCYDLGAREEADAVLAILVKVAELRVKTETALPW